MKSETFVSIFSEISQPIFKNLDEIQYVGLLKLMLINLYKEYSRMELYWCGCIKYMFNSSDVILWNMGLTLSCVRTIVNWFVSNLEWCLTWLNSREKRVSSVSEGLVAIWCFLLNINAWTYIPPHQSHQLWYQVTLACTHVPAVSVLGCNGRHIQGISMLSLFNHLHTSHQCQFFTNIAVCWHWCLC